MESIKQTAQSVVDAIGVSRLGRTPTSLWTLTYLTQAETNPNAPSNAGDMPKPSAYPVHSQRDEGKAVGIQAEMGKEPITLKQEGSDGYELYKAANKLAGKKAIVTGGDSGIGQAAAVMFAMEGADVAIVYLPEEEVDAKETERLILKNGTSTPFFLPH
jgi:hypothetical protein